LWTGCGCGCAQPVEKQCGISERFFIDLKRAMIHKC
jgi:hypothetical protein